MGKNKNTEKGKCVTCGNELQKIDGEVKQLKSSLKDLKEGKVKKIE